MKLQSKRKDATNEMGDKQNQIKNHTVALDCHSLSV